MQRLALHVSIFNHAEGEGMSATFEIMKHYYGVRTRVQTKYMYTSEEDAHGKIQSNRSKQKNRPVDKI